MKDKIKVLQSLISFGVGGNQIFVMNFFRHFNKDKFHIDRSEEHTSELQSH